jgi:CheY-like chemotaxis protein
MDETAFNYRTAEDGPKGLEIARQTPPRLVLMDIQLPGMDGIETMRLLREVEATRNSIIIAVTAHAMKGDREAFLKLGFNEYISKPVKTKELVSIIEHYLSAS